MKTHAVASAQSFEPTGQRSLASRYRFAASTACPELASAPPRPDSSSWWRRSWPPAARGALALAHGATPWPQGRGAATWDPQCRPGASRWRRCHQARLSCSVAQMAGRSKAAGRSEAPGVTWECRPGASRRLEPPGVFSLRASLASRCLEAPGFTAGGCREPHCVLQPHCARPSWPQSKTDVPG